MVVTARELDFARNEAIAAAGIAVISVPDTRWARVDIKSVSLLPNVLAKQAAREQGAREAWFVDKTGVVLEGSSSNAWIVSRDGKVVTRQADTAILRGITRTVLLDAIKAQGLTIEERAFTLAEAYDAREAFVTSASQIVMPVVRIDGRSVGDGKPGPVATALRREFHRYAECRLRTVIFVLPWLPSGRDLTPANAPKPGLRRPPPCHLMAVPPVRPTSG